MISRVKIFSKCAVLEVTRWTVLEQYNKIDWTGLNFNCFLAAASDTSTSTAHLHDILPPSVVTCSFAMISVLPHSGTCHCPLLQRQVSRRGVWLYVCHAGPLAFCLVVMKFVHFILSLTWMLPQSHSRGICAAFPHTALYSHGICIRRSDWERVGE